MVSDFIDEYLNNQSNQAKLKLEQREWTPKGYFELNGEHAGIIVQDFEFPVYGYTIVLGFKLFEKLKNSAIRSSPLYSFRGQNGHGVSAFMEDNVLVLRTYGASGQVKTLNVELLEQVDEYKFIKLAVVHKRHRLYKDSIQVMVNGCIVCSQNLVYPDTRYMRNGHRCLGCAPGYHGMHGLLGFPTMIKGGLEMNTVLNIVQTSWNGDLNDEKLEYCFKYSANLVDLNHSVCYDAANLKQHGWIEPGTVPKIASVIAMDESIACYGGAAWVLLVAFQKCEKHNFDPFFSTLDLCAILLKKERAIQMEFVRYYGVESLLYILLQVPKETWTMQAICSIKNFIDAFYDELDTTYLGFGYRKAVHLILYNTELWLDVSVEVVHFVYKSWIPLACQRDTNCPSELKFSISHLCCISRTLSKSNMDTTSIAHLLLPMVFQPGQTNQLQELLYFIKLRCDEMDSHDQGTDICGILEALLMHLDKTEILQECSSDICSKNTNDQHSISHDKSLISNIERNGGIHFLWKLLACNVDEVTFKSLALLYRLADCVTMSPLDLGLKLSNCLVYSDAILDIAALLLNAPSKLLAATIFSAIAILLNTKNRNKEIFCKVANKLESIHLFSVQGSILTSRNSGQVRLLVLKLEDLAELLTTPSIGSEVRSNVLRITTSIVHLALLYLMDGWKYYVFVLSYLASNSCFNNVSSLAKHIYHGCIVLSPLSSYTDEEHRKLHFWPNLLQCSVFTTFLANRKEILSDATDDDVQIYLHHAVLLWKLVNSRLESTLEVALNNASEDARINGPVNCYSTMFLSSCHHIRLHSLQSAIMFLWFVVGKHSCDYNAVNSCVRQLRSFLEILSEENANCGPQMSSAPKSWYSMYTLQELFNSIERVVAVPANVKPLLKLIAVIAIDTAVDLPPSSPFVPKLLGITSMDISQITLNFPRDASSETNSLVQSWIAESQRTITDYMDSVNLETFDDVFTISDLKWQSTQSDSRAVKAWTKSTNTLIADRLQYIEEDIVSKTCWKNDFSHLDLHFEFLRVDGRVLYRLFEKQWRHLFPNIKVSDDEQNKNLHQLTRTCPSMQKYHFKAKPKPAKLAKLKPCEVLQREKQKTRLLSLKSWCSDGISEEATILADDALRAVVASTSIAASAQAESDSSSESLSDVENCIPDEPCPPNSGNRFGLIASGMAQMVDKAVQDVKYAMDTSASHLGLGDDGCREFANLPNSNQCRVGSEYGFASTKLAIGIFRNLGNLKLKQIIECASIELITAKCNYFGKLCVFKNYILFEAKGTKTLDSEQLTDCSGSSVSKFWVWQIPNINSMFPRRYLLRNSALEIFVGSKAYFLYFSNGVDDFCRIYKSIIAQQPPFLHHFPYLRKIRTAPNLYQHNTKLTKKWVKHEISTFDYLMELNSIAGRTYNDLTQYPVFPWILMDYTSNMLDLTRASSFRDLSLPIGAHAPERFAKYAERYEQLIDSDIPAFMYGSHYSHLGAVLFYLIRLEPFTTFAVQLQGGKLDHPDRLFHSVQEAWSNCLSDFSDVKELTPEWYYLPQFLSNCNDVDFGKRQDGVVVNDVILPSWASDRYDFIHKHRMVCTVDFQIKFHYI